MHRPGGPHAARDTHARALRNTTAPGVFAYHSLEKETCDHVTCAAGDVFGSGRQDIVTGPFSNAAIDHAITIWKNQGPKRK